MLLLGSLTGAHSSRAKHGDPNAQIRLPVECKGLQSQCVPGHPPPPPLSAAFAQSCGPGAFPGILLPQGAGRSGGALAKACPSHRVHMCRFPAASPLGLESTCPSLPPQAHLLPAAPPAGVHQSSCCVQPPGEAGSTLPLFPRLIRSPQGQLIGVLLAKVYFVSLQERGRWCWEV